MQKKKIKNYYITFTNKILDLNQLEKILEESSVALMIKKLLKYQKYLPHSNIIKSTYLFHFRISAR